MISFATGNTRGGTNALGSNSGGNNNSAYGVDALRYNTTGGANTASGALALYSNSTGNSNTASGASALYANSTGGANTAIGESALQYNDTGIGNTAVGQLALNQNTTGWFNTAIGGSALIYINGSRNIGIGMQAGMRVYGGDDNIYVGSLGPSTWGDESNTIRIGSGQTRAFIAGIQGKTTGASNAVSVLIDSNGQLGTVNSSRRYKEDIADMAGASDGLMKLRPVIFRYKEAFADGHKPMQYGLIAEEVADVLPELVVRNEHGEPETVKYHLLPTLLLSEFQKLQQVTVEQAAQIATLEARLAALEQRAGASGAPAQLSALGLPPAWLLAGGLVVAGLLLGQRWRPARRR